MNPDLEDYNKQLEKTLALLNAQERLLDSINKKKEQMNDDMLLQYKRY